MKDRNIKKFNKEYAKIPLEIYYFLKFKFKKFKKPSKNNNSVLIINNCLIGEFATSLFAIRTFIKKNGGPVDMVVSPTQKTMAEKIIGIRNVYTAKSNYNREIEMDFKKDEIKSNEYKKIIVLRPSKSAFHLVKNINISETETSLRDFILYGLHLFKSLLFKKTPKQWKNLNFEMLNIKNENITFNDIFKFKKQDFKKINQLKEIKTKQKLILLHINSNWVMNNWKVKNWVKLLKEIEKNFPNNYRFIFIGVQNDIKTFKEIESQINFKIYSLINQIDLKDLMLIMRKSNYFIGVDSGPVNIAHLCNLRSISIMGPGPHMYLPYNKSDVIIDKSNGSGFFQKFFEKKNGFVTKIKMDEVFLAFKKLNNGK